MSAKAHFSMERNWGFLRKSFQYLAFMGVPFIKDRVFVLEFFGKLNCLINSWIWGLPLIILLVGSGLYLSVRFGLIQLRGFYHAIATLCGKNQEKNAEGEISPFRSLTTALSGTIGTGNIVGVAAAILLGGPGAVFWMWVSAFVGMAIKFTSCTLAVHFRKLEPDGEVHGGPMYFIAQGLGPKFKWMAGAFSFFTILASFGIGTTFQVNNFVINLHVLFAGAEARDPSFLFCFISGLFYATVLGAIIIGGVKKIGSATVRIVPFMFAFYFITALIILCSHYEAIPGAFAAIFKYAFETPAALTGGVIGTVVKQGLARGLFSNEAGLGSASIAHAAAHTRHPVRQGLVAMLGPFVDTVLVCTLTALVILVTSATDYSSVKGELTAVAFRLGLGSWWGEKSISFVILLLAFSTTLSWAYYGDRASGYLFGKKGIKIYHVVYLVTVMIGACTNIESIIIFSDTANGLMAISNLIAALLLSPLVAKLLRDYFRNRTTSSAIKTSAPELQSDP